MHNYMITFPDSHIYIGATKNDVDKRISNHISKWKSGKYRTRKIYQKMDEFSGDFEYKTLGSFETKEDMWESEKGYIALFKSNLLLNNATGGEFSSTGKKTTREQVNNMIKTKLGFLPTFKVFCSKTNNLLYEGNSTLDCSKIVNCHQNTISYQIRNIRNGIKKNDKYSAKRRFFVTLTGGESFQYK